MPVYIIRAGDTDMVKIGWADEPEQRRAVLQTAHWMPLQIVRLIEGIPATERWMHRRFATVRVTNEWFRWDDDMRHVQPPQILSEVNPVTDIIDALDGPAKVSKATGININTVRNWYDRKSIPARYHAAILRIAEGKVTAEQIIAAHSGSCSEAA